MDTIVVSTTVEQKADASRKCALNSIHCRWRRRRRRDWLSVNGVSHWPALLRANALTPHFLLLTWEIDGSLRPRWKILNMNFVEETARYVPVPSVIQQSCLMDYISSIQVKLDGGSCSYFLYGRWCAYLSAGPVNLLTPPTFHFPPTEMLKISWRNSQIVLLLLCYY